MADVAWFCVAKEQAMKRAAWLVTVIACGGGGGGEDAAVDASRRVDASTLDASTDTGADGSEPDADVDSGFDAGFDALVPDPCDEEGAMRLVDCGNCGMGQEVCEEGEWTLTACLGEGECRAGDLEREALPMCAERARLCDAECNWGPWESTADAGECEEGEDRTVDGTCSSGEVQEQVCSAACTWMDVGSCRPACSSLRSSPLDSEEVCIPAGDYARGGSLAGFTRVFVSAFAIDRFPVTNRRFRACREAGACTGELELRGEDDLMDDSKLDWFVHRVSWLQAEEFCEWDGGRRLPTEAEWEKAMRGGWPRMNSASWDDGEDPCEFVDLPTCTSEPRDLRVPRPILQYPRTQSIYGVDDMFNTGGQWVFDRFSEGYYVDPTTNRDPQGPASGLTRVVKGSGSDGVIPGLSTFRIETRGGLEPSDGSAFSGPTFRCARDSGS